MVVQTYSGQNEFLASQHYHTGTYPVTIDHNKVGADPKAVLAGMLLGKITASGLGRIRTFATVATAIGAGGSKTVVVNDARPFVVGDVVKVNDGSDNTVTAIDYAANALTLENTESDIAENATVKGTDGSEAPIGINMSDVSLVNGDVAVAFMVHGSVVKEKLIAYDASVKSVLNNIIFG